MSSALGGIVNYIVCEAGLRPNLAYSYFKKNVDPDPEAKLFQKLFVVKFVGLNFLAPVNNLRLLWRHTKLNENVKRNRKEHSLK
jgi:hypothetical protein